MGGSLRVQTFSDSRGSHEKYAYLFLTPSRKYSSIMSPSPWSRTFSMNLELLLKNSLKCFDLTSVSSSSELSSKFNTLYIGSAWSSGLLAHGVSSCALWVAANRHASPPDHSNFRAVPCYLRIEFPVGIEFQ